MISLKKYYIFYKKKSFIGGTLKIYGESLCRDVPYKTLLLSIRDCAQAVVREMLAKYGMDKTDPLHYCLVQVELFKFILSFWKIYNFANASNNFRLIVMDLNIFLMMMNVHFQFL